jgi:RND family efflux transporter MFP subunit
MSSQEQSKPVVKDVNQPVTQAQVAVEGATEGRELSRKPLLIGLAVFALCLGAVIVFGIRARVQAESKLKGATDQAATPSVVVIHPQEGAPAEEISLPGTTEAFSDTPIYARTDGYLKRWYFDIGARVKKGQLLAVIETPELDQQLRQARADLETSQANLLLAGTTAARWQFLVKSGSVSKQETDQAVDNLAAMKATVNSNAANVSRLEQLQSYENVYAPFDGVVTARNTDVGHLIDAGANTPPQELFHMAAIRVLRVYVPVPEVYAPASRVGASALLTLDEYPGEKFHGRLVRTSDSINIASRTLLVEVDVDNPQGKLLPGAYVFVHLKIPVQIRSVTIPSSCLLFRREGLQVGLVRGSKTELLSVKIGHDYGSTVEIVSGLSPTDWVILAPADSLVSGTPVNVIDQSAQGSGQ